MSLPASSSLDPDFSSPTFSALAWVNATLAASPAPAHIPAALPTPTSPSFAGRPTAPSLSSAAVAAAAATTTTDADAALAAHVASLARAATDAHAELDAALARALAAVPWAVREAEKVRQRAAGVRAGVDGVGERVAGVEGAVSEAVGRIAGADCLVRRVEGVVGMLGRVAAVDELLERLGGLLGGGSSDGRELVSAADVVAELRAALEGLRGVNGMEARFGELDAADVRLGELAEPRLRAALEGREAVGARNARIVFDRAGRKGAFRGKYVELRSALLHAVWSEAWGEGEGEEDAGGEEGEGGGGIQRARARKGQVDLASTGAAIRLDAFYGRLLEFVAAEHAWLGDAFPDLRAQLLPSLLSAALESPAGPTLARLRPAPGAVQASGVKRLHQASLRAVRAAADVARVLLEGGGAEKGVGESEDSGRREVAVGSDVAAAERGCEAEVLLEAVSRLLFPCRVFWSLWPALAAQAAEAAALAVPMDGPPGGAPTPLADTAKVVETASAPLLGLLDALKSQISDWTAGVGVLAVPAATAAVSAVVSRRVLALIRRDQGSGGGAADAGDDDWVRVAGALRLLRAVSALKQQWEARKEECVGITAGPASGILEVAASVRGDPRACVARLLEWADADMLAEASAVVQLVRDETLAPRVVRTIQSLGATGEDLRGLLDGVHRVVYNSMFVGIRARFSAFDKEASWGDVDAVGDGGESMVGFSSSPLTYATEVADYLMTIPQQLEPYVPADDEDGSHSTPASAYAFSATKVSAGGAPSARLSNADLAAAAAAAAAVAAEEPCDAGAGDGAPPSFAGVWFGAVAVGTMELYVERVKAIPHLSQGGARQLAIDVEYICNVLAALGVTPTADLDLTRRLLECSPDVPAFTGIRAEQDRVERRHLVERLAASRGCPLPRNS